MCEVPNSMNRADDPEPMPDNGKQISKEDIAVFLKENAELIAEDIGYLLIPRDKRLNEEGWDALHEKFEDYFMSKGFRI